MQDQTITIPGVIIKTMPRHADARGWLAECFRQDELDKTHYPAMSYVSMTLPGVARGPHEHLEQTDYFCFIGPSTFVLYVWDNRAGTPGFGTHQTITVGEDNPVAAIIPPRVVHAYKNIGLIGGLVLNFPNMLYAGTGKKDKVDEVRYEHLSNSPYKI